MSFGHLPPEKLRNGEGSLSEPPIKFFQERLHELTVEERQTLVDLLNKYFHKSRVLEEQHNRVHRQYQLAQRKYVDLFYFSPIGYFIFDRQGRILEANLTATNAVGHSSSVVIGKSLRNFVVEADLPLLKMHHESLFQGERRTVCEVMLKNKLNAPKQVRLESMLWPDEFGEQNLILTAVIDITLQKEFNDQVKQKSKIDSLESLVGHIAHDFNNVIHSIVSNTEYLVQDTPHLEEKGVERVKKRLNRILDLAARATESINGLLKLSTDTAIIPKEIDLWPFLLKYQTEFEKYIPKKVQVEWSKPHDSFVVVADEEQLRFVFINLIINAVNKMPNGGTLSVKLIRHREGEGAAAEHSIRESDWNIVKFFYAPTNHEVEIDKVTQEEIPFVDLDDVLDIPQVSGIMRQHEGMVRVVPQVDGQTILLYFPVVAVETADDTLPAAPKTTLDGTGKTILLVEDNIEVGESFREILEFLGFSVIMATNGKEALDLYKASSKSIELIITDLVMPEMDGELFLNAVIAFDPDAKVIAISGYPLSIQVNDLYQSGVFSFVQKPFTIHKISRVIQTALES